MEAKQASRRKQEHRQKKKMQHSLVPKTEDCDALDRIIGEIVFRALAQLDEDAKEGLRELVSKTQGRNQTERVVRRTLEGLIGSSRNSNEEIPKSTRTNGMNVPIAIIDLVSSNSAFFL